MLHWKAEDPESWNGQCSEVWMKLDHLYSENIKVLKGQMFFNKKIGFQIQSFESSVTWQDDNRINFKINNNVCYYFNWPVF